jgi:hypothetical protein
MCPKASLRAPEAAGYISNAREAFDETRWE